MKLFKYFAIAFGALAMVACGPTPTPEPEPEPNENNKNDENNNNEDRFVLEDGTILLTDCPGGIYFGDFWDEGIADYYFLLTNDTKIGQTEQGFDVPMTPGRTLLFIDIWADLSKDHTNPIVPEGTYRMGDKRGQNVLTSEFTLATQNLEKVGEQYRIVDIYFSDGTLVVTHTDNGYRMEASFTTSDGEPMKFLFEGEVTLEDKSNDEEYNPELDGDYEMVPSVGRTYLYESYENCDRHVLMLFTSDNLTYDKIHVNEPGAKIQLSLFNDPGKGLAGTYRAGDVSDSGILTKEPGVFYPGRMYGATTALGSFLERVNDDMSVEYAVFVDGELTITENGDGTHTIVGSFTSGNDGTVSVNWTGSLIDHLADMEQDNE